MSPRSKQLMNLEVNRVKIALLQPPYCVKRQLPKNSHGNVSDVNFQNQLIYEHKTPAFLYKLRNAYITQYGPVIHDFRFTPVLTSQMKGRKDYLFKLFLSSCKKVLLGKVKHESGKLLVVHNNYINNYYHWMVEVLFRLYLVKDYLIDYHLVMPKLSFPFQINSLKLFGLNERQLIEITPENLIKAKEVLQPDYIANYGEYQPELLREYATWLLKKLGLNKTTEFVEKRIYIKRGNASYRRVLNEDFLVAELETIGFECLDLETLSFQDQVSMFYHASLVVAPHGAGLTNLIFCRPNTTIIEIFPEDYIHLCYFTMADIFSLHYYYLIGDSVSVEQDQAPFQKDIIIRTDDLMQLLRRL